MEHMCLTGKGIKSVCVCWCVRASVCVFLIDLLMSLGAEAEQQPPVAFGRSIALQPVFSERREKISLKVLFP